MSVAEQRYQAVLAAIAQGRTVTEVAGVWSVSRGLLQVEPEFKAEVVTVAGRGDLTVPDVAVDFGVSEESVRRWMRRADIDDGIEEGQTSTEQTEIGAAAQGQAQAADGDRDPAPRGAYFASSTLPK
jgi:transposase